MVMRAGVLRARLHKFGVTAGAGAAWTPASLSPGALLWYDLSDAAQVTLNVSAIATLKNKGSVSADLTQTGTAQPSYVTGALNGLAIGRFAVASNQFLQSASTSLGASTTLTSISVVKSLSGSNYRAIWGMGDGAVGGIGYRYLGGAGQGIANNSFLYDANGYNAGQTARVAAPTSLATDLTNYNIIRGEAGAVCDLFFNGNEAGSYDTQTTGATSNPTAVIMLGQTTAAATDFWNGDIAELIVADSVSAGDQLRLEGYVAWKWGLQGNLPVGHPYKSAAP